MLNIDYTTVITTVGTLLGGGWLFSLYSAKPRKTSIELENVGKAMEEMNSVIATMKEHNRLYREYTNQTIKDLNSKVDNLEKLVRLKDEAIYAAYDCPFPQKTSDCIVLRRFKSCTNCSVETILSGDIHIPEQKEDEQ